MNDFRDRTCLICDGLFKSPGPHIRKCGTCLTDETDHERILQDNWLDQSYPHLRKFGHRKGKKTRNRKEYE